ncbi:hypothetical protein D9M69_633050 [compost metagenome]
MQERLEGRILATPGEHVTQFRRKVGALTEQTVAADAVVVFPDRFAAHHRLVHLRFVAAFWKGLLCVVGQGQEYQEEEHAPPKVDIPGHALGEGL